MIENWKINYNTHRSHTSLGGMAPAVYATLKRCERLFRPDSAMAPLDRL
ncbi:hypothetical protein [Amaricoccus tamworthensis]